MIEKKKKEKKKKITESAAFCRVGRVTGNNNKFLLGLDILFCRLGLRSATVD